MACFGGDKEAPSLPARQTAEQMISGSPRLTELDQMIRDYIGKQYTAPTEWGTQGDIYNQLLNYTPEQFAYPMADIQKALEAQQAIQLQQYQNQIRPMLANQGQLDSTYYANLLGNYLKGQQAQTYGTTANLLTNQAQQNYNLAQWLPYFKQSVAGQLGNLGTQKLGLQQQNLMLPLQTYIPGLSSLYGTGAGVADTAYNDALRQYQVDMQNYQEEAARKGAMINAIGTMLGAGIGTVVAPGAGTMLGAQLGGTASGFFGGTPSSGQNLGSAFSSAMPSSGLDISSLLGGLGQTSAPQADISSLYQTNFKLPSMTQRLNQGYGY